MSKQTSVISLPDGYREYDHINLQKDKRTALAVNITASVGMIAMLVLGHFAFVPVDIFFDIDSVGMGMYFLRLIILLGGYFAYIVLHELTHATVMKYYGAQHLRFGFTGMYAYAGSEQDYFGKLPYRLIALAPLVVWGVIFTVMLLFIPHEWFWVVYFLQVGNLAGAAGDIYVTVRLWRYPRDILVRDTGIEMFVYSRHEKSGHQ